METVGEDLDDDLHQVFLSQGILAADNLLKDSGEHGLKKKCIKKMNE